MTTSRLATHLASRYSLRADMAEATYWAIRTDGLRLPPRRAIAAAARISEATLSRRFKGQATEEALVLELVHARRMTYPAGLLDHDWEEWLPRSEAELEDVRVWSACQQLATTSPAVTSAVARALQEELRRLGRRHPDVDALALAAVHATITGLSLRRSLDDTLAHADAVAVLELVVGALGLRTC